MSIDYILFLLLIYRSCSFSGISLCCGDRHPITRVFDCPVHDATNDLCWYLVNDVSLGLITKSACTCTSTIERTNDEKEKKIRIHRYFKSLILHYSLVLLFFSTIVTAHRTKNEKRDQSYGWKVIKKTERSIKMHSNDKIIELPSGVVIFQENNEDSSIWLLLFQLWPYVHKSTLKSLPMIYEWTYEACIDLHRTMSNMENIVF